MRTFYPLPKQVGMPHKAMADGGRANRWNHKEVGALGGGLKLINKEPLKEFGNSRTIIIISHVLPYPPAAGNEIRILRMINWLRSVGFKIVYLLNAVSLPERRRRDVLTVVDNIYCKADPVSYAQMLLQKVTTRLGLNFQNRELRWLRGMKHRRNPDSTLNEAELRKKSLAPEELIKTARSLVKKYRPCAVIGEYVFTAPCLRALPSSKMIKFIDTHDVFSRRPTQEWLHCTPEEEREYLLASDVVIAIQAEEARHFQALVPERHVITVGVDYEIEEKVDSSRVVPGRILVVGSDNEANLLGLQDFFFHAWPIVQSRNAKARLRVVGKIGDRFSCSDLRVGVAGWVGDIQEEYRAASVVINPTYIGTGLKVKTVEALCYGKPLVVTSNGVAGLPPPRDRAWIVSDNWKDFAEQVIRLLEESEERQGLQEGALKFARQLFAPEVVYSDLAWVFEGLGGRI
jgi:glycosyltransferase involved in cell wall biosynthesis